MKLRKEKKQNIFFKIVSKILKWGLISLAALIVLFFVSLFIARIISANDIKINTKNGIQESSFVKLGGIQQYISIRGQNKDNPIIIFLHGGPALPASFIAPYYQKGLENDYTFINWDQRGGGRTYFANPNMDVNTQLSVDILSNDLNDLVNYATKRFNQKKVIIMAHSYGTIIGTQYIKQHPDKVAAYIGIGQVVNDKKQSLASANKAIEIATEQNKNDDVAQISKLIEKYLKAKNLEEFSLDDYTTLSGLIYIYTPVGNKEMNPLLQTWIGASSADMSFDDLQWYLLGMTDMNKYLSLEMPLLKYTLLNFDLFNQDKEYKVPVYFISGEQDWAATRSTVEDYYKLITAPDKKMIVIKDAGHSPFMDNPKVFQQEVRNLLKNK